MAAEAAAAPAAQEVEEDDNEGEEEGDEGAEVEDALAGRGEAAASPQARPRKKAHPKQAVTWPSEAAATVNNSKLYGWGFLWGVGLCHGYNVAAGHVHIKQG